MGHLGEGISADVYLVKDEDSQNLAAVKLLKTDQSKALQRTEYEALKECHHSNVIKLFS